MVKFKMKSRRLVGAAAVAAASCVPIAGAFAQDAARTSQQDDALEEIVVTAERRTSDVTHTPISMVATSGESLTKANIVTINELQNFTPGFSVNNAGQYNSINIRGIGNGAVNPAITPGIAVQRDGMIQAETIMLSQPFWDIDHVEVLRGPQGTFIGQSSTGGALLIISRSPTIGDFNGYVNATYGNYNNTRLEAAVNLPISDTWAARIAVNMQERDSYYFNQGAALTTITNTETHQIGKVDDKNIRLGLLYKPSDSFQALLKVDVNTADTGGTTEQPNQNTFLDPVSGQIGRSPYYAYSTHQPYVLNYDFQAHDSEEKKSTVALELRYTFDNGMLLRSFTGYLHDDIRENPDQDASSAQALFNYHLIGPNNDYYQQEFNLSSADDGRRLSWIVGASVFHRDTPVRQNFHIFAPPYKIGAATTGTSTEVLTQQLDIHAVQRTMGAYGQVAFKLTDPLQLTVGVRGNWDRNYQTGNIRIIPPGTPGFLVSLAGVAKDNEPTWKVGLNYTPTEDNFYYAFVARGYKSAGVNSGTVQFDPEHLTDYEIGWKSKFLDNHVQTEIGVYYIDFKGLQLPVTNPLTGTGGVTNVSGSKIKGVEASIQARLGNFNIEGGVAYNDTELGSVNLIAAYRLPAGLNNNPQCGAVLTPGCFNYNPYKVNVTGGQNPFSPKLTLTAGIDYGIPLGSEATLRPRVTYSHTDKQYGSVFQTDNYFLMESRDLIGASVAYERGPWTAAAFGNNLSDQTYTSAYSGNYQYYGSPREYGLRVSRTF